MASAAADLHEQLLALPDGPLDFGIARNHAAGNLQRRLEHCGSRDIRAGEFVDDAVSIGVSIAAEPLGRLHSVMLIEGIVGEFAERNYASGLMPGPDHQSRRAD